MQQSTNSLATDRLHAAGLRYWQLDRRSIRLALQPNCWPTRSGNRGRAVAAATSSAVSVPARNGLVALIRALAPPHIAAWGDLDAHGVAIVADLATRLECSVHPVGMDPELFQTGIKRTRTDEERREARELATKLSANAPEALRPLAALIATNGDSCEQQTIRAKVAPRLGALLRAIERGEPPVILAWCSGRR